MLEHTETSTSNQMNLMMKDEAIVLTAAVIRLSPPGQMPQTCTPGSHTLLLTHAFTYHKLRHDEKHFHQCHLLSLLSKASLPHMLLQPHSSSPKTGQTSSLNIR